MMLRDLTTWNELIAKVEKALGEVVTHTTLTPAEGDREFDCGYGGAEGCPFTAWTENWVLFPLEYDGSEYVGYAPRNPSEHKMRHQ
jgi:hypothetical protein